MICYRDNKRLNLLTPLGGGRHGGVREDLYRLRIGDYRVIYAGDEEPPALRVIQILSREQAYGWL